VEASSTGEAATGHRGRSAVARPQTVVLGAGEYPRAVCYPTTSEETFH
jgi:hypothetical protein